MAIGNVPFSGFQLVDGDWLLGLVGGHNMLFKNGLTAVGTNQATALQLPDRVAFFSVDTSSASTGVALPVALAGVSIFIANNTANNISAFPSIVNNPVTGTQDTVNNTTSVTINAHTGTAFTCAKNGTWYTN